MTKETVLSADALTFGYGKTPLFKEVSFSLGRGEILSVLGPNGSGKTTLLKCLMGMLKPLSGAVRVFGRDIRTYKEKELFEKMAYVPQNRDEPLSYSVLQTVLIGLTGTLGIFSEPEKKEIGRAEETLSLLGIEALRDRSLKELSGGEIQMVLLARALVKNPAILILDEPESGLDFKNQLVILEALYRARERGVTSVFNTHYPEHAFRYADRGLLFCPEKAGDPGSVSFGPIHELVTAENIERAFGVEVSIGVTDVHGRAVKSVIPVKPLE